LGSGWVRNGYISRGLQISEPSPEAAHTRALGPFLRAISAIRPI